MFISILFLAIVIGITFVLGRKAQNKIVSDQSPFSFADDMLIINARYIFFLQNSSIRCIELQYNPKALQNRYYNMGIHIVKTDGSCKNIPYRGCRNGAQPQDMLAALTAHQIQCTAKN